MHEIYLEDETVIDAVKAARSIWVTADAASTLLTENNETVELNGTQYTDFDLIEVLCLNACIEFSNMPGHSEVSSWTTAILFSKVLDARFEQSKDSDEYGIDAHWPIIVFDTMVDAEGMPDPEKSGFEPPSEDIYAEGANPVRESINMLTAFSDFGAAALEQYTTVAEPDIPDAVAELLDKVRAVAEAEAEAEAEPEAEAENTSSPESPIPDNDLDKFAKNFGEFVDDFNN